MGTLIKIVRNKKILHIICKKKYKKKRTNISSEAKKISYEKKFGLIIANTKIFHAKLV